MRYALLALLLAAVAALAITSVRMDSATADEGAHIASGYLKLKYGWLDFYAGQPPLSDSHAAVFLTGYDFPRVTGDPWTVGRQFLYESGHDPHRTLWLGRLPSIAALLALCGLVFAFVGRWTSKPQWALVAAALTGFCPTILAYSRLATNDVFTTFFLFAAMALCLAVLEKPRAGTAILLGVVVACALLTKLTALILGPYLLLLFLWKRAWRPMAIAAVTAVVVFAATYAIMGRTGPLAGFKAYAHELSTINYYYSGEHGQVQYLLGEFSTKGWPHYYLVALGLKVPVAALILIAIAIVFGLRGKAPFALHACLLFIAVFLAALMRSNVDLGVRYAMPLLPFAYSAVAIAFSRMQRRAAIFAGVLVAWHVAASLVAYPNYISYFNEFVRDARDKDRYLIDSNLDWGQDLIRLDRWCAANHVDAITVHYFGGAQPERELHARVTNWNGPNGPPPPKGFFALSRHYYRLTFYKPLSPVSYAQYFAASHARFVTTIGGSIDVYRVE
jgi:hypothetical protein